MNETEQILAVKELGEKIGYGNMMTKASSLWAINLEDKHGITTGNFIPATINMIKEKHQ
ncbi:hypothetical protein [Aquibacillus saliphilus]|uniref:hypothetical protein n=1 Tax=Aquibacillus saliphilus TaxID=1909422 RepID=UPI001CF0C35F|nr:hypothetical protein [Aquibacillus saliphilus]